jgi:hypothetical protein
MLLPAMLHNNNIEIKLVDHTDTPDKVLFYNASAPIEAKRFINVGLRPIHVIVHNKTSEPVVISAQSVGDQQPDIKEIIKLFHFNEISVALAILTIGGYFTGFVNIAERNNAHVRWYPFSLSCIAASLYAAYYSWQSTCDQNIAVTPLIKKHILSSRTVIAAGAKRETITLIDTSISTNRCFFNVFNLEGAVIATFDHTFIKEEKK